MPLSATELAEDSRLEGATVGVVTTSTLLVAPAAAATTKAAVTTVGVVAAVAATTGHQVCGGVRSPTAQLEPLLMTNQLCIQFTKRDGFYPSGHGRHHGVEVVVEAHQDVGHHLTIFQSTPGGRHLISERLHLGVVLRDRRRALGHGRQHHVRADHQPRA